MGVKDKLRGAIGGAIGHASESAVKPALQAAADQIDASNEDFELLIEVPEIVVKPFTVRVRLADAGANKPDPRE